MKTFFIVLNMSIILLFIFYIIFALVMLINHKKTKGVAEDAKVVINESKKATYVERLGDKILVVCVGLFIILTLITTFMEGISESIVPLYIPILFINLRLISYEQKLGFIITKDGIKVGLRFIKWRKIKDYDWTTHKKEHDKVILRIKKYHAHFPVTVAVNKGDKDTVESLFQKGLEANG